TWRFALWEAKVTGATQRDTQLRGGDGHARIPRTWPAAEQRSRGKNRRATCRRRPRYAASTNGLVRRGPSAGRALTRIHRAPTHQVYPGQVEDGETCCSKEGV